MALMDGALTTLSAVKAELGVQNNSLDTYLEGLINQASSIFVHLAGKEFHYKEDHVAYIRQPRGSATLSVDGALPLIEINSISKGDHIFPPESYAIEHPRLGFIISTQGTWPGTEQVDPPAIHSYPQQAAYLYVVNYKGGYVTPQQALEDPSLTRTLPYDIEAAVIQSVLTGYSHREVDPSIASVKVGNATTSWATPGNVGESRMAMQLKSVAQSYRTVLAI